MARLPLILSCLLLVVGLVLMAARALQFRRAKKQAKTGGAHPEFIAPIFFAGTAIWGAILAGVGAVGTVADLSGVFPAGKTQDRLAGVVDTQGSWQRARLKPDPGQIENPMPADEYVVLVEISLGATTPSPNTAYDVFQNLDGWHCVLHGAWVPVSMGKEFRVDTKECHPQ